MSASHTKGPWHFLEEGRTEEPGNACRPLTICDEAGNDLANVYSADDSTVDVHRDRAIANARLIAAAPDLLDALRDAEKILSQLRFANFAVQIELHETRAAISKAEGR